MGQTNVFEGLIAQTPGAGGPGVIRWGARRLEVATTGDFRDGQPVAWLVPSDFIAIAEPGDEGGSDGPSNVLEGVLAEIKSQGERSALTLRVGETESLRFNVATRDVRARALQPGAALRVRLLAEGIHLMPPER
jgi:molybdate transport system ATP-binding protein